VNRWALALVDGFLTLISKQAYIQVALLGCGFVHAMKVALAVQIRHPVKLGIIHSVSEVLRFLGTVTVVAVGLVTCWGLLTGPMHGNVTSPVAPCILVGFAGFLIGECILHPFSKAAVAALHCYVADKEMSDHLGFTSAQHTPLPLHRFISEHIDCRHAEG
jgi:hypothetical protein